jgi:RNA polymerase sigma factor (sigma-70 family)
MPPVWCNAEPLPNDIAGVMPTEKTSAGFEETYRAQRLPLMRFAYLLCGSTETSEDVVQSAFASAQSRWDQIENPASYLRRSVLNLVKDGQRRRYRLASLAGSVTSADAVALPPEVDETWTLIQQLPWPQRAVVVLHYYEDLPLVEIAAVLRRSESTVRSDHRRALDRLRKALR